jgi:hypothetical protein
VQDELAGVFVEAQERHVRFLPSLPWGRDPWMFADTTTRQASDHAFEERDVGRHGGRRHC